MELGIGKFYFIKDFNNSERLFYGIIRQPVDYTVFCFWVCWFLDDLLDILL